MLYCLITLGFNELDQRRVRAGLVSFPDVIEHDLGTIFTSLRWAEFKVGAKKWPGFDLKMCSGA